jgi:hypothetical protein|nr:MAG TPA: hypothetical protein [Caudoviricetes sp.]
MTNNIKLGTLVKYSESTTFYLHDVQYDISEIYVKSQIIKNKQLKKMKVINFKILNKNLLYVNVEE